MWFGRLFLYLLVFFSQMSCQKTDFGAENPGGGVVQFTIQEIASNPMAAGDMKIWRATYHDQQGHLSTFKIQLRVSKPRVGAAFVVVPGSFMRDRASDTQPLINALAAALEVSAGAISAEKAESVPFSALILNSAAAEPNNGAATAGMPITTTVFVGKEEAQFYLSLNPAAGIGQITLKDPAHSVVVLKEISKIL